MFCERCGKENNDGDLFCEGCGAPLGGEAAPQQETPPAQPETPHVQVGGKKGKIVAARDKVLGFERKHAVIVNALILAFSIIFLFVALFAPIKFMVYQERGTGEITIPDDPTDPSNTSYSYIEVDQTIWDVIGATAYINLDRSNPADVAKIREITVECAEAVRGANTIEERAERLSDVNYIAYLLATYSGTSFGDFFMNGGGAPFVSVVFGLVVAILSIIMAIMSLVRLIYAIIGLVKKKTTHSFYSYLKTMFGLNVASLGLLAAAPMFKVGGGMFGLFVLTIVTMLILGSLGSLVMGKAGLAVVIKKSAITLGLLIGACLLCTNAIDYNVGDRTYNAPYGYGFFKMMVGIGASSETALFSYIGAFVLGMLGVGLVVCGAKAAMRYVMSLSCVQSKKNLDGNAFGNSLGVVIITFLMIMVAFVGVPFGLYPYFKTSGEAVLSPQVYVAAVFFLAALIVMKAYKPMNNPLFPAPDSGYVTVNGAPAPEAQATEPVQSIEDIKEPEVDAPAAPVEPEQEPVEPHEEAPVEQPADDLK